MEDLSTQLVALLQIIVIDVVLAGDNAIVVGLAASRVAPDIRAKVIFWGIAAAVVLRVLFAAVTTQLLAIVGLTFAGGILLLWVCWKMYREIRSGSLGDDGGTPHAVGADVAAGGTAKPMNFWSAVIQILIADVSMSLDNVLAVAGAAKGHLWVLIVGLALSVVLMAIAATFIAKLLAKYHWITWIGLAIILYVAVDMIWRGSIELSVWMNGTTAMFLLGGLPVLADAAGWLEFATPPQIAQFAGDVEAMSGAAWESTRAAWDAACASLESTLGATWDALSPPHEFQAQRLA
jgi:YjbE family integral membrane protein